MRLGAFCRLLDFDGFDESGATFFRNRVAPRLDRDSFQLQRFNLAFKFQRLLAAHLLDLWVHCNRRLGPDRFFLLFVKRFREEGHKLFFYLIHAVVQGRAPLRQRVVRVIAIDQAVMRA